MARASTLRVALTADDAPSIAASAGGPPFDPARMDRVRETLRGRGVSHCLAFVIGAQARGNEGALERWLQDGYELGNHGFDHVPASRVDPRTFLASVEGCDAVLREVGAFDAGRRRWFRYPHLDRGHDAAAREAVSHGVRGLGYTVVPASTDLFDHRYEGVLARAEAGGDAARAARIGRRYQEVGWRSLQHCADRLHAHLGRPVVQIPFFHFGRVSERFLAGLLERIAAGDMRWCPVEEAVVDPVYDAFERSPERTGLVTRTCPAPLPLRIRRVLARLSDRAGLFAQQRCGPRWPHLV
jgi:peptidoglycan/xylan/chitin deacetylase (PgdA/CDA1 family)